MSLESRRLRARIKQRLFGRCISGGRLGRYELRELLGTGGMGAVYSAYDPELRRAVAVKVLFGPATAEVSARLRREGRALAALSHPHVVPVYEFSEADGRPFVVMELVDGQPLDGVLALLTGSTRARFEAVLELLLQAGRGLQAAHAVGLCHRDFKPTNVLVGRDGRVRVADFGLARSTAAREPTCAADGRPVGGSGSAAAGGTPAYMAPEQLDGDVVDHRADQFAFCVTAFEAIYGERPFRAESWSERRRAIERGIVDGPSRPGVPRAIASLLARGLRAAPAQRHADLGALLDALARHRRRTSRRLALAIAGGAVVIATISIALRGAGTPPPPPPPCGEARLAATWAASGDPALDDPMTDLARRFDLAWAKVCATPSQTARHLRMSCLSARSVELDVFALSIQAAAATAPERLIDDARALPDPEPCLKLHEGSGPAPRRDQPRHELQRRLDAAEAALRSGQFPAAWAEAVAAQAVAQAQGRMDLDARARLGLGALARRVRNGTLAREYIGEAYSLAIEAGDDVTAARAAVQMLRTTMLADDDHDRVEWSRHAGAAVARADDREAAADYAGVHSSIVRLTVGLPLHPGDLEPDEALLFAEAHAGVPGCHGHGCAHDLVLVRWDPTKKAWVDTTRGGRATHVSDRVGFGRPVRALSDGEVIACWRNYPDHGRVDENPRACACHESTGEARCDIDADADLEDAWRPCTEVVRPSGNFLTTLDAEGNGINYVHLQSGSIPAHLCPNGIDAAVPDDIEPHDGFIPQEYLTVPQPARRWRPRVARGDVIGRIGSTGTAQPPCLHVQAVRFEARDNSNFDQLDLLEIVFDGGSYQAATDGPSDTWQPLAGHFLNALLDAHGPIVLRPSLAAPIAETTRAPVEGVHAPGGRPPNLDDDP